MSDIAYDAFAALLGGPAAGAVRSQSSPRRKSPLEEPPSLGPLPYGTLPGDSAVDDSSNPLPQDKALESKYGPTPHKRKAPDLEAFYEWAKTQGLFGKMR